MNPSSPEIPSRETRVRELVDAHLAFIWRTVRRLGVAERDADDAAQEVFVVAARRLDEILPGRERAFLFGTALRVAATRRRSRARRPEELSPVLDERHDDQPNPEEMAHYAHARRLLAEILDELTDEQRIVFTLYELEELSAPEIAELLEVSLASVTSRLRRAREAFRAAARRVRAEQRKGGRR